MNKQPEALRLAEKMESYSLRSGYAWHCHKAAAELRRLHEINAVLIYWMKYIQAQTHIRHIHDTAGVAIAKASTTATQTGEKNDKDSD